jgi:hypothetical protein
MFLIYFYELINVVPFANPNSILTTLSGVELIKHDVTIYNITGEWDNSIDHLIGQNYFESYIQHITPNNHHNTNGHNTNLYNINQHHLSKQDSIYSSYSN